MSHRFTLQANYTFTHALDDVLNSTLVSEIQSGEGVNFLAIAGLSDSYVGIVPTVTDPVTGQTNATSAFIDSNNFNPVPKAGTYYNGANVDKGPSDLALAHTFLAHGIVQLPWQVEFASIFRAQSGGHYGVSPATGGPDFDGDGLFNGAGLNFLGQGQLYARNRFTTPAFINADLRVAKRFNLGERVKAQVLFEFFNMFNRANPAAVNGLEPGCADGSNTSNPFATPTCNVFQPQQGQHGIGDVLQWLPGREGQFGIRLEF
jgi:hypothetical protein